MEGWGFIEGKDDVDFEGILIEAREERFLYQIKRINRPDVNKAYGKCGDYGFYVLLARTDIQ
jgi:hypothetical protein